MALLLVCLSLVLSILTSTLGGEYFIVAPNVIRVDVDETILINVHDTPDDFQVPVTLYFLLPGGDQQFSETTVFVTKDRPKRAIMRIPSSPGIRSITLVASANTEHLHIDDRRIIPLSYQSGFVFIQTDKPLYTPSQRVEIRVITLEQDMTSTNRKLRVDIVNPDKIIVHRYNETSANGSVTIQFAFPSHPRFGNWTVNAYYKHLDQAQSTVKFEVKEYVLPKFDIKIDVRGLKFIVPETESLVSVVTARYNFGDPVYGYFFISYGVVEDDGSLAVLQEKNGQLNDGTGYADLVMSDVTMIDWAERFMGKRLLIQAFVTDGSSGEIITANNTMVTFSRTPYKFNWDLTQRYFKKGLPYVVKASLYYLNGLPAAAIPVKVSATVRVEGRNLHLEGASGQGDGERDQVEKTSGSMGELDFRIDVHRQASLVTITLETKDPALQAANTRSTFTAQPQGSSSQEYMVVRLPSEDTSRLRQMIESQCSVEVQLTNPENVETLNYFVISAGRIVHMGAKNKDVVNQNTDLSFSVTHAMSPSSRVVAYYASTTGYIIADSLYFEVEEKCQNTIGLDFKGLRQVGDTFKTDATDKNIELQVTAENGTRVGLIAVDEAVFTLRKYYRLSQKKVLQARSTYDLGCGPGGGMDAATVFKDAGVTVLSNANLVVDVEGCQHTGRRVRRSLNDTEMESMLKRYDGIEKEYCQKGMRKLVSDEYITCIKRANLLARRKKVHPASPEIETFITCCLAMQESSRGRSGDNDVEEIDDNEVLDVRSYFPESWIFPEVVTDGDRSAVLKATLPDSATTWILEAVGTSDQHPICVNDSVKLEVRPSFFVDLGLPYSVQRFEQIEIIASIFNYNSEDIQVNVYLKGVTGICSEAQPNSYSEAKSLHVLSKQPGSVAFVIVPLDVGTLPIEIVARSTDGRHIYPIRKFLTVRPEGYQQTDTITGILDPQNILSSPARTESGGGNQSYQHIQFFANDGESKQINIIHYGLNSEAIPDTYRMQVSLIGSVMGSVIHTVIGGLDRLLRIPTGCGEQTMLGLAPNVYVYAYLRNTGQMTAKLEKSAEQFIYAGVERELNFRKADGSFAVWAHSTSSTWLTAFVSKVMCQARDFGDIDDKITCKAMTWLLAQAPTQPRDGSFQESYTVHHKDMTGGVQGKVSLSAFILIALLECGECNNINKADSLASTIALLEQELPGLTRPYAIAITAYALAKAQSSLANEAIDMLKTIAVHNDVSNTRFWSWDDSGFGAGPKPYWYNIKPVAIEIETTSYALLALLEMEDIHYTHAIVNWLTDQSNYDGGFVSTQDTVIALQALSAYAARVQQYDIDMQCTVDCQNTDFIDTLEMRPANAIVRWVAPIEVPKLSQNISVFFDTKGSGLGQFKFESVYYVPQTESNDCDFELVINEGEQEMNEGKELNYNIRARYLREGRTGMAIIDVGLYSGYKPVDGDLKNIKEESNGRIQRYEVTDRSVVFYIDEIQNAEDTFIQFHALREYNVSKLQPVKIHVYDFYNPTVECVKFISLNEGSALLGTLCTGNTCVCATGKCAHDPYSNTTDFLVYEMRDKACKSASHFAYEVRVKSWRDEGSFRIYTMTVLTPLKLGLDNVYKSQKRTFWMTKSCETTNIKRKKYLIIGSGGLAAKNNKGQTEYKYVINEETSIYDWPSPRRILSPGGKAKQIKKKLEELKEQLIANGCPT